LRAVATLAEETRSGRALDLGCGRGEIAMTLASMGHQVTAIDYSPEAIHIAQELAANAGFAPEQIRFICDDVNGSPITGLYDIVVAVDLIERMSPDELDLMYARVAAHLSPNGMFIVRTFPNIWFYQYHYPSQVQKARLLGAYLPEKPRTPSEKRLRFNEQSPRLLRRQLRRHFPSVQLWFARHDGDFPFENLERCY
jgi:2-polyprenyl-3-methyl-5-hydroxy-6-metoxy-1,4-benzoquinol methylase